MYLSKVKAFYHCPQPGQFNPKRALIASLAPIGRTLTCVCWRLHPGQVWGLQGVATAQERACREGRAAPHEAQLEVPLAGLPQGPGPPQQGSPHLTLRPVGQVGPQSRPSLLVPVPATPNIPACNLTCSPNYRRHPSEGQFNLGVATSNVSSSA